MANPSAAKLWSRWPCAWLHTSDGLLYHTDRGCQYTSTACQALLTEMSGQERQHHGYEHNAYRYATDEAA